jgi:hypothetical protein
MLREITPFEVGAYCCVGRLGAGRLGELFCARHRPSGTDRLLRRLAPSLLADERLTRLVLHTLS